jgi:hypothetical protein
MSQEIDVDKILNDAELNAERFNKLKGWGKTNGYVALDGLLQYCDIIKNLCERIKELEKELENKNRKIDNMLAIRRTCNED